VDTTRHIAVIGGGPAGTLAAITAKKQDPSATVTLLTDEPCEPYEKPPLSKAVLLGKVQPSDARIAGPGGVASHGVVLHVQARCAAIDRDKREVVLEDGRRLPYDALVLAMGSLPREIPQLPSGMSRVFYLRTEADAHALKGALDVSREVLVVGGGLIGLEVAASAAELGVKTTVLEVASRILLRVCDDETADVVQEAHVQHGVDIRLNTTIVSASLAPDGRLVAVTPDGERIPADLVVVGTGVRPNDALAAAAGLFTCDGVVVDEHCRTSDPAIFAAGDVVRFPGPRGLIRLENWRHAQDQGSVAGRNAAGANDSYATMPSFWSEQYDLYIQGIGWPDARGTPVRRLVKDKSVIIFSISDGYVKYAMGINAQRDLAFARRLIERRIPVDAAALADPAQPLAAMLKRE
jgi:3-phenylpropionate/trans-cinnamate dioxygenase ferredoxin reductase subunit